MSQHTTIEASTFYTIKSLLPESERDPEGMTPRDRLALSRELNEALSAQGAAPLEAGVLGAVLRDWHDLNRVYGNQDEHRSSNDAEYGATQEFSSNAGDRRPRRGGSSPVEIQTKVARGEKVIESRSFGETAALTALGVAGIVMPQVAKAQGANSSDLAIADKTPNAKQGVDSLKKVREQLLNGDRAGQKVYVVGSSNAKMKANIGGKDVTVDLNKAANQLEQWLDARPQGNWKVVIVEKAEDAIGLEERAAEWNLHPSLANSKNPTTGESDGCVFFLIANASQDGTEIRRINLVTSEAYENRGLSDRIIHDDSFFNIWVDAWQDGGNIVRGFKNMVGELDARLGRKLQNEQAVLDAIAADINSQSGAIEHVREQAKGISGTGDLARPEATLSRLEASLDDASNLVKARKAAQARGKVDGVKGEVRALGDLMTRYAQAPQEIAGYRSAIDNIESDRNGDHAQAEVRAAKAALSSAEAAHKNGSSTFAKHLADASDAISRGESKIRAQNQKANTVRIAAAVAGFAAVALATIGAIRASKRRKGAKDRLGKAEANIREKFDALNAMLGSMATLVGTSPKDADELWDGETQEAAEELFTLTGNMFIHLGNANERAEQARDLIKKSGFFNALGDTFIGKDYLEVIETLGDKQLPLDMAADLDLAFGDEQVRGTEEEWKSVLRRAAGTGERTISFNEIVELFVETFGKSEPVYTEVKDAILSAKTNIESAEESVEVIDRRDTKLSELAKVDPREERRGWFVLKGIQESILPRLSKLLKGAAELQVRDPLGAVRGDLASALRIVGDTEAVLAESESVRKEGIPELDKNEAALESGEVTTGWISAALKKVSDKATDIAGKIAKKDQGKAVAALAESHGTLRTRVRRAVGLDARRRTSVTPRRDQALVAIEEARATVAKTLGLSAEKMLREKGQDPDAQTDLAARELKSSKSSLDKGAVTDAEASLDGADRNLATAESIVAGSLASLREHAGGARGIRKEVARIAKLEDGRASVLRELDSAYADHVVEPVSNNVSAAMSDLKDAGKDVDTADTRFEKGALLKAAALLRGAASTAHGAEVALDEIVTLRNALKAQDAANVSHLRSLERAANEMMSDANDDRTRGSAYKAAKRAMQKVRDLRSAVTEQGRDPADVSAKLGQAESKIATANTAIAADWSAYDDAVSAIRAAKSAISAATSYYSEGQSVSRSEAGYHLLQTAESELHSQDYESAEEYADRARRKANNALSSAQSRAVQIRAAREAEERRRREAEERRRREEEERSSSGGSGGSGGSSGGGGSGMSSRGF